LSALSILSTAVHSQNAAKSKLSVGDAAPKLSYSKWIQGEPRITELASDKTYVIEFWATWCGPCIAAMPHLSELSKKYVGKVDFIGCDVWENKHGGDKNQESYYKKVAKFVEDKSKLGKLTYNVITDNTAEDMGNNWLNAAGIDGIPSSFIINKGKIAWIGHPAYLDSIVAGVLDGTFDPMKVVAKTKEQLQYEQDEIAFKAAITEYKRVEATKDYDKTLLLIEKATADFPAYSYMFVSDKFMLLLNHFSQEKAIAYGWDLQKAGGVNGQIVIANLVDLDLDKPVYEFAAEAMSKWDTMKTAPKVLDYTAMFYMKAGHFDKAVEYQKKTIAVAKADKSEYAPTEGEIQDYEKKLEGYEKKLAESKKKKK
jgi:thiol-disulfide isomerase/thioredoxin